MAWVVGIGIFLFLLFAFPRQIVGLIAILAAVIFGLWAYSSLNENARKASLRSLFVTVSATCNRSDYPLYVTLTNGTGKTVTSTSFKVSGYKPGYSSSVASEWLTTDKIMKPGEVYTACWRVNGYGKEIDYSGLEWRAEVTSLDFG
ncbi:hypothetical protein AMC87_CH04008 [Rhizobium phaseoli]|uniref:hypothetical protein n=1 Tax=Rhizobium phaseoli TaxID=396 RepID=UPI0007E97144|nr:hypothetical protein [Rhizobium phaseoli]ANL48629.1 hypothetical protein AMC87_CH04008 [Rhizobium phaseoli]